MQYRSQQEERTGQGREVRSKHGAVFCTCDTVPFKVRQGHGGEEALPAVAAVFPVFGAFELVFVPVNKVVVISIDAAFFLI